MEKRTFGDVAEMWLTEKKYYVKRSTYAAYSLLVSNHLIPEFGDMYIISEH